MYIDLNVYLEMYLFVYLEIYACISFKIFSEYLRFFFLNKKMTKRKKEKLKKNKRICMLVNHWHFFNTIPEPLS